MQEILLTVCTFAFFLHISFKHIGKLSYLKLKMQVFPCEAST